MQIIGCVGVTYWLNCYLLENYRLCRCNVLIVILRLANYRLCRCNILNFYCLQIIDCVGVGLWLECYCLLIIGCVVCCVVIGILLLGSSGADSGLVKLGVMTNVFFNNQQHKIKIKPFLCVKEITSSFLNNSWNQRFYS